MNYLKFFIEKYSTPKYIWSMFILTLFISLIMVLITGPKIEEYAHGMLIMDVLFFGYDIDYVNALFKTLGKQGRSVYLYQQIPVDMIYPIAYGFFSSLSLAWIIKKQNIEIKKIYLFICMIPLLAMIFDFIENSSNALLLIDYPNISSSHVLFSSLFTNLKYLCLLSSLIIFLIFSSIYFLNKKQDARD